MRYELNHIRHVTLGMATGRDENEFRCPIPIPVEKIHLHPHT